MFNDSDGEEPGSMLEPQRVGDGGGEKGDSLKIRVENKDMIVNLEPRIIGESLNSPLTYVKFIILISHK